MAQLEIVASDEPSLVGRLIHFGKQPRAYIGRISENEYWLDDPTIARVHAYFRYDETTDRYFVESLTEGHLLLVRTIRLVGAGRVIGRFVGMNSAG